MKDYNNAWSALIGAIATAQERDTATFGEHKGLTVDQQLKAAEVAALLSISQELSALRHNGISPEFHPDN